MARKQNGLFMENTIEPGINAPLDARQQVKLKTDLTDPASYPTSYVGMLVACREDSNLYVLTAKDTTVEANWKRLVYEGEASGSDEIDLTEYAKLADLPTKTSDLTNDSGYQTAAEVIAAIEAKLEGYRPAITVDTALNATSENPVQNKVIKAELDLKANATDIPIVPDKLSDFNNDAGYQTATEVGTAIDTKLANYQEKITIDDALSSTSENPVQNKAIKDAIDAVAMEYGQHEYNFSWDETNSEIVSNEGDADEQRLKITGFVKSTELPEAYDDTSLAARVSANEAALGGHTVGVNVPADAKFTDTVYDDTQVKADIAKVQSDLANYYLKSESYSKEEIDTIVATINSLDIVAVTTLPTQNIRTDCIYLVKDSLVENNLYSEWIYVDNGDGTSSWEKFGSASIDASNFVTKDELATELESYSTTEEMNTAISDAIDGIGGLDNAEEITAAEVAALFSGGSGTDPNQGSDPNEP